MCTFKCVATLALNAPSKTKVDARAKAIWTGPSLKLLTQSLTRVAGKEKSSQLIIP